MKKISVISTVILLLVVFQAHAFASDLKISTRTIRVSAKPGAVIDAPLTLTNPTDNNMLISYSFEPFKSDESGRVEYLAPIGSSRDRLPGGIQLEENGNPLTSSFSLGPQEKKIITLHMAIPDDQKESDYYFSIVFISENSNDVADNSSFTQIGIATNVILSVGSKTPVGTLEEFGAPLWQDHGPIPFTVKVGNTGIHAFSPKGYILITNMFGQTIGKVDLQQSLVLSGEDRLIPEDTSSLSSSQIQNIKNGGLPADRAYWPEKPTFGLYKADLYISYFPNGQIVHRTIHFLSLPLPQALITGLLIVFLSLLIKRALKYTR